MRLAAGFVLAIGLTLAAGATNACPGQRGPCDRETYRQGGYDDRGYGPPAYGEQTYRDGPYDGYDQDAYGPGHAPQAAEEELAWPTADGWYMHGHRAPPRPCGCQGEVSLNGGFFADAGGVGPIPSGGYDGGGYVILDGGRSAFVGGVRGGFRGRPFGVRSHGGKTGH
jgi:hypothetical protein